MNKSFPSSEFSPEAILYVKKVYPEIKTSFDIKAARIIARAYESGKREILYKPLREASKNI